MGSIWDLFGIYLGSIWDLPLSHLRDLKQCIAAPSQETMQFAFRPVDEDPTLEEGLRKLLTDAAITGQVADALVAEPLELGAARADELMSGDRCGLQSWGLLRPLEKRRFLSSLPG